MSLRFTLTLAILLTLCFHFNAQNVGIGNSNPQAKTHVTQTTAADGVLIEHSGTSGIGLKLTSTSATNTSEGISLFYSGLGRGSTITLSNASNTDIGFGVFNSGTGTGIYSQTIGTALYGYSTGNNIAAIYGSTIGTGTVAVEGYATGTSSVAVQGTTTAASTTAVNGNATGTSSVAVGGTTTAASSIAVDGYATGTSSVAVRGTTTAASTTAVVGNATGTSSVAVGGTTTAASSIAVEGYAIGTSSVAVQGTTTAASTTAVNGNATGTSSVAVGGTTTAASSIAVDGYATGTSSVAVRGTTTAASTTAVVGNATGNNSIAVYGTVTGTDSNAGQFRSTNASNTLAALSAVHNGTGPGILVDHNGTGIRYGIVSLTNPNGLFDPIAVYGVSYEAAYPDYGIGVQGEGGWYGVHGLESGTNLAYTFAVYGTGDYGGTGAKYFSIDHPLDPENKILNHYSIESNEITNMYRGIVTLDGSGQAIVQLPDYFDAANIDPSYQLTAIGTSTPPYVAVEEANNQFVVGGAPNTKVSWTVYAKRNDATIRYFDANGKNYDQEEVVKPAKMKGKYYTPEAYGKPESMGIHYQAEDRKKRTGGNTLSHPQPVAPSVPNPNIQNITPTTGDIENK